MPWKALIPCHVCHVADNSHVIVWDGLSPPEADRLKCLAYCFRCPLRERLQLVEPNKHRWERVEERVIHRVTHGEFPRLALHEHRPIQLLEYGDAQPY